MTSKREYHDVSFLHPWVDFPFKFIDGYVDPNTGFQGCKVKFYRKSGWTKEKHGGKSWWVVEGHTAAGIFTRKPWADTVMNEPYLRNESTTARKIHKFSSFEEAHHCLAEVCCAMHAECVIRNRDRILGPYVPTEEAIASAAALRVCCAMHAECVIRNRDRILGPYVPTEEAIASAAALRVAQGDTGLTQDEINEQSDGEPWRKGLSLVDCIALGVDYQSDEE
ncbi:hypothetical protein B0H16DRAFT_1449926 [Mycena metata]|uniref:Uncharacterized protein n=1 Tax=Mycena metata TaxID=1033252 RepID=A0AAD7K402_9AGAR|nr:hypothetical protein B0H16DRAFT_1449926 [Mycena metata]